MAYSDEYRPGDICGVIEDDMYMWDLNEREQIWLNSGELFVILENDSMDVRVYSNTRGVMITTRVELEENCVNIITDF